MINNIGQYNSNNIKNLQSAPSVNQSFNGAKLTGAATKPSFLFFPLRKENVSNISAPKTKLTTKEEFDSYNALLYAFSTSDTEKTSPQDNVSRQTKLDALLKNGVLLNNNSNDKSTVLQNLTKTINNPRAANMDNLKIAGQIIDTLYNPAIITQRFGDIPKEAQTL